MQATWGSAGVLVAGVANWEEHVRAVPEHDLAGVMATLTALFGQMADSVGLVRVRAGMMVMVVVVTMRKGEGGGAASTALAMCS